MQTDIIENKTTSTDCINGSLRAGIADGFKQAIPIIVGFIPVGFTFGVLATKNGLPGHLTVLMSFLVLAGSSQFIAVSLFAASMSPITIIITTFIVNLRHFLMSAAIAPHLSKMPLMRKLLFSFQLIDESFAIHMANIDRNNFKEVQAITLNCIAHLCWTGGTLLGVCGSHLVADIKPLGFDYALPAMFVVLLIWQVKSNMHAIVALISASTAIGLYIAGAEQLCVIIAAIIGATAGVVLCNIRRK
ncbi:AzlC family ABC transporter permease [Halodesulfovibrio marinisediminis]|uniref:4-azaleucine resistance probable transporter AzlC n=1 Tax=Halodesulfovibrio marinisediminis DSM 17456 TaxID=1121457 RepID=A0A1N6GQY8_9BACT|nr:AzlC family ABC transporter permease [Halodesulfovibrio marinisediminis]SIO09950.1 4-azaleucine resistance probable transporter AzlC [Halodesulfovibrio marinisediminis DSM 17456]